MATSLEDILGSVARWNGLSSTERIDFLSCWLPACGKTASDWNAHTEEEQMVLLAEFFRAERQLSESQVEGANSSWWQAQCTEQKLAYLAKARISLSGWSQTLSVDQRSILVAEFKKLNEQEGELRALQDPAFANELARLRGLSYQLERNATRQLSLSQGTRDVLLGMIDDRAASDPLLAGRRRT